ncbi:MAG: DUF2270 domain-containing protein [Candidatus Nanohaloarchaea archaeon]|nr:DUF2270 domain-containing protein [Candidatus Nanohaloarchaea archaeon]
MAEAPTDKIERYYSTVQQLYRGEMQRANLWRERLDTTTNWAVIITAGVLTWAFSSPANPHIILLLSAVLVLFFSVIEARRYRFFDVWRSRIRVIEENFFAPAVNAEHSVKSSEWTQALADDLEQPGFKISFLEAWSRRVKRNYFWLLSVLLGAWIIKVVIHPSFTPSIGGFVRSAGSSGIPGTVIVGVVVLFYGLLGGLVVREELRSREAKGKMSSEQRKDYDWQDV